MTKRRKGKKKKYTLPFSENMFSKLNELVEMAHKFSVKDIKRPKTLEHRKRISESMKETWKEWRKEGINIGKYEKS